jgi:hypothetical protein
MFHATCMQVNHGDSWLLVLGSEISSLILGPSFGHKLCFKYPNRACEPILNICVLRIFQGYKELFNPMSFDAYNWPLKIRKSIETPLRFLLPKWELTWECGCSFPSHFPTLLRAWNVILGLHFWPAPLQAFVLLTNPMLRLRQFFYI